ncbi:MAG: glycine betaine ABC transporter substrate-binding protein [Mycobacteriales bacterium]
MKHPTTALTRLLALTAALALSVTACGGDKPAAGGGSGDGSSGAGGSIAEAGYDLSGASLTVGSKEFTESIVLGQITLKALQAAGANASDKTGLTGSATVREALESGEIDMYWEYTGTGYVNILGNTTEDVPEDLYATVAAADAEQNDIVWLEPAPMNDTYRIAITAGFADESGIKDMSDVAAFVKGNPDRGAVCAASEFINRDDGLPGLEKAYGFEFSDVVELDLGLVYTQVGKTCPFGEVFSTDGRIVANDLVVVEDDKGFFVDYNAALTMRQETLGKNPDLTALFADISAALTSEVITGLNAAVDVDGKSTEDVAEEFLRSNGFIG